MYSAVYAQDDSGKYAADILYVSSSYEGVLTDGSIEHPFTTIPAAIEAAPRYSTILLKCGDRFPITASINLHSKHLSMGQYGEGALPVVSGFRELNFTESDLNRLSGTDIWQLVLPEGNYRNIGFLYDRATDIIAFGRRVRSIQRQGTSSSYLCREGDFYQSGDTLSLYCAEEVFPYDRLEVAYGLIAFEFLSQSTVQDIRVEGFGGHGFSGISVNSTIRRVEIDLIGGSNHREGVYGRYGNGIEIWIATGDPRSSRPHDVLVEDCTISRVYDAACTLQGEVICDTREDPAAWNIVFSHNTITHCRQSYECFVRQYDSNHKQLNSNYPVRNCRFEHNHCSYPSENGFRSSEHRDCHLYGGTEGMVIADNTFIGGGFLYRFAMDGGQRFTFRSGNRCELRPGDTLLRTVNSRTERYEDNLLTDEATFRHQIREYRAAVGDWQTRFTIKTDGK